jgi:hypothetical protein
MVAKIANRESPTLRDYRARFIWGETKDKAVALPYLDRTPVKKLGRHFDRPLVVDRTNELRWTGNSVALVEDIDPIFRQRRVCRSEICVAAHGAYPPVMVGGPYGNSLERGTLKRRRVSLSEIEDHHEMIGDPFGEIGRSDLCKYHDSFYAAAVASENTYTQCLPRGGADVW